MEPLVMEKEMRHLIRVYYVLFVRGDGAKLSSARGRNQGWHGKVTISPTVIRICLSIIRRIIIQVTRERRWLLFWLLGCVLW